MLLPRIDLTMRKYVALAGLLILPLPAAAAAASCTAEQAHYVQAGRTGFTAMLVRAGAESTAASDLLFVVKSKSHAYRFRFQQANGYGGISLEPVLYLTEAKTGDGTTMARMAAQGRPQGDQLLDMPEIRFIPYRADLTEIADAPQSGGRPPQLIVLPDLGAALWYDSSALGGPKARTAMPRSAFVLAGCGRRAGKDRADR